MKTLVYVISGAYYILETFTFVLCSELFNGVLLSILHHLISLCLIYFSWIINLHRAGVVILFFSDIIVNLALKPYQISKITKHKRVRFWSFWIFFIVRICCKLIFLKLSYFFIFDNPVPIYPAFFFFNTFIILLIIHNAYINLLLTRIAFKKYPLWKWEN